MEHVITVLKASLLIIGALTIIVVLIQPSQKTGLIGDTTDAEIRVKRGFELFLFKLTVFLITLFIGISLLIFSLQTGVLS